MRSFIRFAGIDPPSEIAGGYVPWVDDYAVPLRHLGRLDPES
jgi:hypothetical protein